MINESHTTTIFCESAQRTAFAEGDLRDAWARAYPMLFDDQDVGIARNQPRYHFAEWLSAIHLYHAFGYLSLVEQYEFPSHRRKRSVVEQVLPDAVRRLLTDRTRRTTIQAPDLLVYSQKPDAWFFCEVKGPGDRRREVQDRWFDELAEVAQRPVHHLRVLSRGPAN